jgi:hypothetical protein
MGYKEIFECLVPYLPYDLPLTWYENRRIVLQVGNILNVIEYSSKEKTDRYKPILRPLSDLTKEIEVNGKKFVPAKIIWQISTEEEEFFDIYGGIPDYWKNNLGLKFPNDLDYMDYKFMLKYHFDIFGLLEKKLAIPYKKNGREWL